MIGSFIAIKGNFLDKANEIFNDFQYGDAFKEQQFDEWQAFNDYLFDNYFDFANKGIAIRGIWCNNDWTIINDPEMVDLFEEEVLMQLSEKFNTEIITFVIQESLGLFGFTMYNKDIKRAFFVSEGKVENNLYEPLEQEKNLNINEKTFVDDILKLADKLGVDLEGKNKNKYVVKQLAYEVGLKNGGEEIKQQNHLVENKKSWWKFW